MEKGREKDERRSRGREAERGIRGRREREGEVVGA